eukprot:4050203-Prymnesium_polylepis.2
MLPRAHWPTVTRGALGEGGGGEGGRGEGGRGEGGRVMVAAAEKAAAGLVCSRSPWRPRRQQVRYRFSRAVPGAAVAVAPAKGGMVSPATGTRDTVQLYHGPFALSTVRAASLRVWAGRVVLERAAPSAQALGRNTAGMRVRLAEV